MDFIDDSNTPAPWRGIPAGYRWTIVMASLVKRYLTYDNPTDFQLLLLTHLDKMTDESWLTRDVIAAVKSMPDEGEMLAIEARKAGPEKSLDIYAQTFDTFVRINPSILEALKLSPMMSGSSIQTMEISNA